MGAPFSHNENGIGSIPLLLRGEAPGSLQRGLSGDFAELATGAARCCFTGLTGTGACLWPSVEVPA